METLLPRVKNAIVIENGRLVDCSLDQNISFNEHDRTLNIASLEPVDLQVILKFDQEQAFSISYHGLSFSKINIIEHRLFNAPLSFKRTVDLEEGADVSLFILDDSQTSHLIHIEEYATIKKDASLRYGYGELSYHDVEASLTYDLNGVGASCHTRIAALASQQEKKHFTITLNHHAKDTYGQMDNYGVTQDASQLILDGIGRIHQGHHGSSTHQTNKIIVFDPKCHAEANPYLYIDEYDVQASHAAGVGRMDDEHLYYLQSRGLSKSQAMHLITYGYLIPVTSIIDHAEVKNLFIQALNKKAGV